MSEYNCPVSFLRCLSPSRFGCRLVKFWFTPQTRYVDALVLPLPPHEDDVGALALQLPLTTSFDVQPRPSLLLIGHALTIHLAYLDYATHTPHALFHLSP